MVDTIEEELESISTSGDYIQYLNFIETYSGTILHPNHYLIMTASRNLIQFYTYCSPNECLESTTLTTKYELCKIFDTVLGKIDPGYSEMRNFVQKELHFTRLLLCQQDLEEGKIGRVDYLAKTRQSMSALQEIDKHKQQLVSFNCG